MDIEDLKPRACPRESVFFHLWEEACKKVDEEEAMIAEYTDPLEERIRELEAALGVFVDLIDCCCDCFFNRVDDIYPGEDNCTLPDDDQRPCVMGWREWALKKGRESIEKESKDAPKVVSFPNSDLEKYDEEMASRKQTVAELNEISNLLGDAERRLRNGE